MFNLLSALYHYYSIYIPYFLIKLRTILVIFLGILLDSYTVIKGFCTQKYKSHLLLLTMLLIKNLSLFPSCQLRFYNKLIYFKKNYAKYSVNFSFGTSRSTSPNPDNTSHTRAKNEDKTTNTRTTKRKSKNNNLSSIKVGGNDLKGVGVEYNKLYYECMNEIYDRRFEIHNIKESKTIQDLTKQEYDILNKVFNRVNNASMFSKSTSNTPNPSVKSKQYGNTGNNIMSIKIDVGISPYWDPFKNIKNLKLQIISEYNQLKR